MGDVVPEDGRDATTAGDGGAPGVRPYDFRRPYQAQVSRPSTLEPTHATFASRFAKALSEHLRTEVAVTLAHVEQLRYDEFQYSIGPLTCLSVLRVDPPGAHAILDLSLAVVQPMIVRLLGGSPASTSAASASSPHALTDIEKGLALQIIERAARQLADAWNGPMGTITVREESLEDHPAGIRLMPADEMVTAIRFDVRIGPGGSAGGTMSLCLSDPIVAELDPAATPAPSARPAAAERQDLHRNILDSAVELRALLAETKVRLSDVLDMQAGDVITTDKPASHGGDEVQVQIEGQDKLVGNAAQLHGNRVVQINRVKQLDESNSPRDAAPPPSSSGERS